MNSIVSPRKPLQSRLLEDKLPASDEAAAPPNAADPRKFCLADLLRASAPCQAFGFALSMHERACESYDDHWRDIWQSALEALRPWHETTK